jgi:hypothetical protein
MTQHLAVRAAFGFLSVVSLVGCNQGSDPNATNTIPIQATTSTNAVVATVPTVATPTKAPPAAKGLTPNGVPATKLALNPSDQNIPAEDVFKTDLIDNQNDAATVRLFGVTGGDPAMNGLMTYLGFSTVQDSKTFLVGDFLDYKILATSPYRIDLEISESTMDASGAIGSKTRKVILAWTTTPDVDLPSAVSATPAN